MQWWASLPDGMLAGRYRIESKIGEGGMAEVFLARQQPLGNKVAIKVPKLGTGDGTHLLDRFTREVSRQNQERIVGVIGLLDAGEWEGGDGRKRPYLVMEYVSGGNLGDRLRGAVGESAHRQSPVEVLAWLAPIATTLDRLHGRGLLHRDVKPDNILFNADGDPLLSDFGIATTLDDAVGNSGDGSTGMWVVGSPGYMSPEVCTGEKVAASDQFSLGITVYAALAGRLPAQPNGFSDWMKMLSDWRPEHIACLRPDLPAGVADAVMRSIARDRRDRFPTCSAFAERMRDALRDPPASTPLLAPGHQPAMGQRPPTQRTTTPVPQPLSVPSGNLAIASGVANDDAPRGHRFLARLIDAAFFTTILVVFGLGVSKDTNNDELTALGWIGLAGWAALTIAQALFVTRDGQTIGKKMLGLRVIDASTGENPGFLRGFLIREIGFGFVVLFSFVALGVPLLIDVLPVFGARRRCLHDTATATRVIDIRTTAPKVDDRSQETIAIG